MTFDVYQPFCPSGAEGCSTAVVTGASVSSSASATRPGTTLKQKYCEPVCARYEPGCRSTAPKKPLPSVFVVRVACVSRFSMVTATVSSGLLSESKASPFTCPFDGASFQEKVGIEAASAKMG